jgi:hypothetical protein
MGRGDAVQPPRLLLLALQCLKWGALPQAGGLLDQPAGLVAKMGYLINVYQATSAYYGASDPTKWADGNSAAFDIYARARELETILQ